MSNGQFSGFRDEAVVSYFESVCIVGYFED
jgi:hypothetical protein